MIAAGPDLAPEGPSEERKAYDQVLLFDRLRVALRRLNPELAEAALEDAFHKLLRPPGPTLEARNRAFHRMLVDGVTVEFHRPDGSIGGAQAAVVDFDHPENNDWLAVNQFTVIEDKHKRRPDIVLFVNGLPLAVIELKNPADEKATVRTAYNQLQTYKAEIPSLFTYNELLVASDGIEAKMGSLTAGPEWFKPWRTISGEELADPLLPQLEVLVEGVFEPGRMLDLIRSFIVFEDPGTGALSKKIAGYHQFHAVRVAVGETLRAARQAERQMGELAWAVRSRVAAGRPAGRPAGRGGVAHAGLGQEPDDGLLRRPARARAGHGQPDHRRAHRSQRP